MADPVTLAVIGATAGAALNPDDPLKGAVIGGTLGFGGASLAGLGAAGGTAAAGTTVGAAGGTGVAQGLTATTTGSLVPGSALGNAAATQGLNIGANTAMAANAPLAASAPAASMGVSGGLSAMANPAMSATAPFAMSTSTPTMISSPMFSGGSASRSQIDLARQIAGRSQQPQDQTMVNQGGMMRPGQRVNVVEPVASLLEPLRNRRPRPDFSLL